LRVHSRDLNCVWPTTAPKLNVCIEIAHYLSLHVFIS
jgi:hypothetical protein